MNNTTRPVATGKGESVPKSFPHHPQMSKLPGVKRMMEEEGGYGYGVYMVLLELLCAADNKLSFDDKEVQKIGGRFIRRCAEPDINLFAIDGNYFSSTYLSLFNLPQ